MSFQQKWWHTATIYEAYPASFKDSNADGIGDIPGLTSRVKDLKMLGIDAVWLAACFRSGGVDMGYDVVNFKDIDPQYGTVEDMEKLIAELKRHNMRLILDIAVNHTSDQHPWFQASRSSKSDTNSKRGWYIWRKGREHTLNGRVVRSPPNNWESIFKGPAWEYDEVTDEWYLCIFGKNQPDLNWDRFEVRAAMNGVMMFWLAKGVAGFRLDVVNMISKPADLEALDAPVTDKESHWQNATSLYCNGPKLHEYLKEMRSGFGSTYASNVMLVGEVICTEDPDQVRLMTDPSREELDMAYTYDLFSLDVGPGDKFENHPWTASEFKQAIIKWQTALAFSNGAWQAVWLESHDSGRSISRFGIDTPEYRFIYAKLLALLQSTLGGTLFIYQGQEIGMVNLHPSIPISEYPDVETRRTLAKMRSQRAETYGVRERDVNMDDIHAEVHKKARDHARAPLPWTAASTTHPHAGFSSAPATAKMWSPMNPDSDLCNINNQIGDRNSVLRFWRSCLSMRRLHATALVFGDFRIVPDTDGDGEVFAYWRIAPVGASMLVVLNLTPREPVAFTMPRAPNDLILNYSLMDATYQKRSLTPGHLPSDSVVRLEAYQGMIFMF